MPASFGNTPEELAERVLEAHGGDYRDGDGGQGQVEFYIAENRVRVEFGVNVVETRDDSQAATL